MGPKKVNTITEDEVEEIKKSLNFMSEEISNISKQQKLILSLMDEIKELQKQNAEKDKKITTLECRVADLEQYTRLNDIIVSGLETKPRSYARAARAVGEPTEPDLDSLELQVVNFFDSKGIKVDSRDIEACHPLPTKNKSMKPAIIIRFVNRKKKTEMIKQGKKLRGTNVYLNDHLTKKNADIARQARIMRKQGLIQSTWTYNCKVIIKLNGPPEEAKILTIKDITELVSEKPIMKTREQ